MENDKADDNFENFIKNKINQLSGIKKRSNSKNETNSIRSIIPYTSPTRTSFKLRTIYYEINSPRRIETKPDNGIIKNTNKGCGSIRYNKYDIDNFLKSTNSFLIRSQFNRASRTARGNKFKELIY
jgi:hypothetical protein